MRLQVTLLLLLGLFLKELCLASKNLCNIKIKDFNTYEISCTKDESNNTGSEDQDQESGSLESNNTETENQEQKPRSLCCQLLKEVKITDHEEASGFRIQHHVKFAIQVGDTKCVVPESVDEKDIYKKMVVDSFIEENTCKITLRSNVKESDSKYRCIEIYFRTSQS